MCLYDNSGSSCRQLSTNLCRVLILDGGDCVVIDQVTYVRIRWRKSVLLIRTIKRIVRPGAELYSGLARCYLYLLKHYERQKDNDHTARALIIITLLQLNSNLNFLTIRIIIIQKYYNIFALELGHTAILLRK